MISEEISSPLALSATKSRYKLIYILISYSRADWILASIFSLKPIILMFLIESRMALVIEIRV